MIPQSGGRGRAGALMARAAVRESMTDAGRAARARVASGFADGVPGPVHPCGDVAVLLVTRELSGNSVQHSGSGDRGRRSRSRSWPDLVRVEVTDRSSPGAPELRPAEGDAEDGRGLGLVARLAARWGWRRRGGRTATWSSTAARLTPARGWRVPAVDQAVPARDLRRGYLPATSGSRPASCKTAVARVVDARCDWMDGARSPPSWRGAGGLVA